MYPTVEKSTGQLTASLSFGVHKNNHDMSDTSLLGGWEAVTACYICIQWLLYVGKY